MVSVAIVNRCCPSWISSTAQSSTASPGSTTCTSSVWIWLRRVKHAVGNLPSPVLGPVQGDLPLLMTVDSRHRSPPFSLLRLSRFCFQVEASCSSPLFAQICLSQKSMVCIKEERFLPSMHSGFSGQAQSSSCFMLVSIYFPVFWRAVQCPVFKVIKSQARFYE